MQGRGLHGPALLVVLQQPVQLLQVCHDVVLDVRRGDLQPHAAAVKGSREVPREHLVDHPGHNGDHLLKKKSFLSLKECTINIPVTLQEPLPWMQRWSPQYLKTHSQTSSIQRMSHLYLLSQTPSLTGVFQESEATAEQVSVSMGIDPKPNEAGTCHPRALPAPRSASSPWVFHQATLLQNRSRSRMVAVSQFVPSDGQSALGGKAERCRAVLFRLETPVTSHLIASPGSYLHCPPPPLTQLQLPPCT